MKSQLEEQRSTIFRIVTRSFAVIMVVLYIVFGTTIIIKSQAITNLPRNYSIIFGALLILYGLFRAFKVYRNYSTRSSEEV